MKDINIVDSICGNWPLSWAAQHGSWEIAELLIAKGADVNAKDLSFDQNTPLIHASIHGHVKIAELLIANGANFNA